MKCSNCGVQNNELVLVCEDRKFYTCQECSVNIATDREGKEFKINEIVMIKPGRHSKLENREMIITGFFLYAHCESGRMVWMKDKETQKPLKIILDTNWLIKLN